MLTPAQQATWKFCVEILTFVVLIIYTTIAGCNLKVVKDQFQASTRAYVGVGSIALQPLPSPDGRSNGARVQYALKNYGTIPGDKFAAKTKLRLNSADFPTTKYDETEGPIFPGQSVGFDGQLNQQEYEDVRTGRSVIEIFVKSTYESLGVPHEYCDRERFQHDIPPSGAWLSLGSSCDAIKDIVR